MDQCDQPKEFDDFTQGALQETTVVTVPLSPAASAPAGPNATANGTSQKLHKKERSRNKSSTLGQTQKKKKKRCSRGQKSTQNHSRLRAANWRSSQLPQLVNGI
eukprot:jgi/Chrzof1/8028/UNPLg00073.t1